MSGPIVMDWISDDEIRSIGPEGVASIVARILAGEIKLSASFKERVRQQKENLGSTEAVVFVNRRLEDRERMLSESYRILCKNGKVDRIRLAPAVNEYFANLHGNITEGKWIFLAGPAGWGKRTSIEHLCWLDKGDHEILWCTAKDFQEWSCDKSPAMRNRMMNCPVLVLEKIDRFPIKGAGGSYKMEIGISDVLDHREKNRKSVWITSMEKLAEFGERFGEDLANDVARACESKDCNFYNNFYVEELI